MLMLCLLWGKKWILQYVLFLMWDPVFQPQLNWIIPSSGLISGVRRFEIDVSGLPVGAILSVKVSEKKHSLNFQDRADK
jgi:hypothetical protein